MQKQLQEKPRLPQPTFSKQHLLACCYI
jgi:hypothetical protein